MVNLKNQCMYHHPLPKLLPLPELGNLLYPAHSILFVQQAQDHLLVEVGYTKGPHPQWDEWELVVLMQRARLHLVLPGHSKGPKLD